MPEIIAIKSIFKDAKYRIPIYQREYAWTTKEITQLLSDLCSKVKANSNDKYYLGTLVVYNETKGEQVIDGQQRLTTLYILLCYLAQTNKINYSKNFRSDTLSFDTRPDSIKTLQAIHSGNSDDMFNASLRSAYNIIKNSLKQYCDEYNITISEFSDYLLNQTLLLKVEVPPDTDLNHYFEIMNVRGEQLEKHEVLKSRLMSSLDDEVDRELFTLIWDGASDMNRYLQMFFQRTTKKSTNLRKLVFGKDGNSMPKSYEELYSLFEKATEIDNEETDELSIEDIITGNIEKFREDDNKQQELEKLTSVINFPNFLLHVLKIMTNDKTVVLDDKQLLEQFERIYKPKPDDEQSQFSKDFIFALFKIKFLYDKYIIRNLDLGDTTQWVLRKQIHKFEKNKSYHYNATFGDDDAEKKNHKRVVMLQSMFHVSFPTRIYKHWLCGTLKFLCEHWDAYDEELDAVTFTDFLEQMSDAFFYDRNQPVPVEYDDILFENDCKAQNENVIDKTWRSGVDTANFIFNRLDYLLWYFSSYEKKVFQNIGLGSFLDDFQFGFRTSVEHFYPQQPRNGQPANYDIDRFGNLCLISQNNNSRFSNDLPEAKKANYQKSSRSVESLKMELMWNEAENWGDEYIVEKHEEKMKEILLTTVNIDSNEE